MCDYSLHAVESRPAVVGDKLVTTEFAFTSTRGFSAAGDPSTAVCLLPGTEIVFDKEVDRGLLSVLLRRPSYGKVARFRKINMENGIQHHDALEFSDGRVLLLTSLRPGQTATVLQLPSLEAGKFEKYERPHVIEVAVEAETRSPAPGRRLQGARLS